MRFKIGNKHRTVGGYTVLLVGYTVRLDWVHFTAAKHRRVIHELAAVVLDYNVRGRLESNLGYSVMGPPDLLTPPRVMPAVTLHDAEGRFVSGPLPADLIGAAAPFGQPLEALVGDGPDEAIIVLEREPHPMDIELRWLESAA